MFGPWEWLLIGLIVVLVFGPKIFVRAGSSLGQGVSEYKKAVKREDEREQSSPSEEPPQS
ncbi:MAG: twin-arginine translocase TatA/TatE family subunit [Armatimonadetes bacterium]|nr:twin-arginine translocase TatA/TatE family subunit [Armatimonadota bacterium]